MNVCLNMIVRNEAAVIRRCLESVRPFVQGWCIVDTGSTDGTQAIIRQTLADLPGQLLERPWIDQEHNRNEALSMARKCAAFAVHGPKAVDVQQFDYVLFIDAAEVLVAEPDFALPELGADAYECTVRYGGLEFARTMLVKKSLPWRWIGKRHPKLRAEGASRPTALHGIHVLPRNDGASWSDPDKYSKHAAELEVEVAADPLNPRLRYYLAQSYRDAGELAAALDCYLYRSSMTGSREESWSALYEAAKLRERLGQSGADVIAGYLDAFRFRPTRREPLLQLCRYLRQRGDFALALIFARAAAAIPRPADRLFVEVWAYETGPLEQMQIIARDSGDAALLEETTRKLVARHVATPAQGEALPC